MGIEIPTEFVVRLANGEASDDIELLLNMCGVENTGGVIGEQIVRCKDCVEYNTELYRHISCELLGRYVEPDGFCAWGVRREP